MDRSAYANIPTGWAPQSRLRIELQSANQFGQTKIVGEALVALL